MAIIISKNGKNAKKVDKSNFEKEDYLQKYIYDNPESIPLYDIKEDIKILILIREFSVQSGSIDAIGIDKDGEIYPIETKLYKNPDKRLVVAQVLDYGASLWRHFNDFNEFVRLIDGEVNKKFGIGLNQRIKEFFGINDEDTAALLDNMKRNLNDGKFRFVVLMDKLHDQLKDLIVFINENSEFDIFAVELEYYKYEDYEIMIPKLFGSEIKKSIAVSTSSNRKKWDELSFFELTAKSLKKDEFEAVKKIYEFSKKTAEGIGWGTGFARASFGPKFSKISETKSLYTVKSDGKLSLNFGWLNDSKTAEEYRDKFKKLLENKKLFKIPEDYQTHHPEYKIEIWSKKVDDFIEAVGDLLKD